MIMMRRALPLLLLVLSAGCSWLGGWFGSSDSSIRPAELKPVASAVNVQQLWEAKVGAGTEGQFFRLIPALADGRIYAASHDGTVLATTVRFWRSTPSAANGCGKPTPSCRFPAASA